jgi:MiaB/RimO family radical SAM methylthiotransferase
MRSTFSILHNGCDSLEFDALTLCELIKNKLHLTKLNSTVADINILMGCSFTEQKELEFKNIIDSTLNGSANSKIIVTGCFLNKYINSDNVFFVNKESALNVVASLVNESIVADQDIVTHPVNSRTISISEGCYGQCSYCSVKAVRGAHRSRPPEVIIQDVEISSAKHDTIKLVGQDIAAYGRDISSSFFNLLLMLIEKFSDTNFELGSLNPKWLRQFTLDELSTLASPSIVGNVHVTLQSASNSVLEKMKRDYTYEQYLNVLGSLRDFGIEKLSTDILTGFPSETPEDHSLNIDFLKENKLAFVEIFMYEPRPNTLAATYTQIHREIRLERTLGLIAEYIASYIKYHDIEVSDGEQEVLVPFNTNVIIEEEVVPA